MLRNLQCQAMEPLMPFLGQKPVLQKLIANFRDGLTVKLDCFPQMSLQMGGLVTLYIVARVQREGANRERISATVVCPTENPG